MGKYFGTDGIRGKYGENLNAELAYKTGLAVAGYFGGGTATVGRDTRVSGEAIEDALVRGLTRGGMNVKLLSILPTPAVAKLTVSESAACGIMVSASHNPPEYNGIKIFGGEGLKLTGEQEGSIEYYIDNPPRKARLSGKAEKFISARDKYIESTVKAADTDLRGLRVKLDCGYGAASTVAEEIFTECGAVAEAENCSLCGEKINSGCGALFPDWVLKNTKGKCRLGFAFDGDADRLAAVMDGQVLDGDSVLYNIAKTRKLSDGVVVGTVLSNLALERRLEEEGGRLVRTPVGDKYISELMNRNGYTLGGEQSGHYIIYPECTTGDGILSALMLSKALYKNGILEKAELLKLTPQKAFAFSAGEDVMYRPETVSMIEKYTEFLAPEGRLIVRYSGTEPKVRVMAESDDSAAVDETLKAFEEFFAGLNA